MSPLLVPPSTDRDARPHVVIVSTGSANLASARAAFDRLGCTCTVTSDCDAVAEAPLVVLPGVGAFGPAMQRLCERTLDQAIIHRVRHNRPLLAICLGLQLLCEASEESPGVAGLGLVGATVRRFASQTDAPVRIPHMGWNSIAPTAGAMLVRPAFMYFANSYRVDAIPIGWHGATSDHAGSFASALERGPILACQFHPELSGAAGLDLIRRWLARCGVAVERSAPLSAGARPC